LTRRYDFFSKKKMTYNWKNPTQISGQLVVVKNPKNRNFFFEIFSLKSWKNDFLLISEVQLTPKIIADFDFSTKSYVKLMFF